jgi:hypothetical protein
MSLTLQGANRIGSPLRSLDLTLDCQKSTYAILGVFLAAVWELRYLSKSVLKSVTEYKACGRTTTPLIFLL